MVSSQKCFFFNLELKEIVDKIQMFVFILEDFLLVKEDLETHRKCTFVVIFSYLLLSEKKYPNNNCYSNVFIIGGCHVILRISVFLSLTNTVQYLSPTRPIHKNNIYIRMYNVCTYSTLGWSDFSFLWNFEKIWLKKVFS